MKQKIIQYLIGFYLLVFAVFAVNAQELKLEILNGHSGGGVLAVAVSSDGKFALTGSTDQTALLWDLETGKQLSRFVGHEDAVSAVQFSKDGQFVLTASHDKTARLWETATGRQIRVFVENRNGTLIAHSGAILSAAISADGKLVATAGEDKTARIWDLASGKQLHRLDHAGRVNSIAFSPDSTLLLTGGEDKIARLYSTANGKEERQFVGHTGEIRSVAYSPDGKQILSGSSDKSVRLWNVTLGKESMTFAMDTPLLSVSFDNDYEIFVADYEGIKNWNIDTGKLVSRLEMSAQIWVSSPVAKRILVVNLVSENRYEKLAWFDKQTIKSFREDTGSVNSISISSDFKYILIGSDASTSSFWNIQLGKSNKLDLRCYEKEETNQSTNQKSNSINFVPIKYSNETSDFVKQKPVNLGKYEFRCIEVFSKAVTFIDNESFAIASSNEGIFDPDSSSPNHFGLPEFVRFERVEIFNIKDLTNQFIIPFFGVILSSISALPNKKTLLISPRDYIDSGLWEVKKKDFTLKKDTYPKSYQVFEGRLGNSVSNAVSLDGKTVAVSYFNKFKGLPRFPIHLFNTETGEVKQIIKEFLSPVLSIAFSPNGKTIATASRGKFDMSEIGIGDAAKANSVRLFDVETGKEIESFGGEFKLLSNKFAGYKSLAYSPDGKFIAAGSFDGKIYLRNNETKELKKFEGHTDTVNSVKFAKDANGKLLVVSGSSDSTTRIWDAATGEEICALVTFRDGNWAVVQTKTGRYDAPNGGEIDGIQWVFGTETIALNQLKDIYYTPNLLPRLLGYNKEPLADVRPLKDIKLFPEIVENNFDKTTAILTVKLKNRGGGIGAVRVMVNGSLATEDARSAELIAKLKANPNLADAVIEFELKGSAGFNPTGENRIEVITNDYDEKRKKSFVSSNPKNSSRGTEVVNLGGDENKPVSRTLYAIVGGISDYNGTGLDLNFAAKDAEDFANALGIAARGLFCETPNCTDRVKIKLLTTPPKGEVKDPKNLPTKTNFRAAFAEIAKEAKPEDVLVVYLAGHGTSLNVGDAETYFYLTQESEVGSKDAVAKNPERAISNAEILDWLTQEKWTAEQKGIKARNQVLILDTCAAGAFEKALTRDLSADQIRALEKLKDRTGLQILMGSAANQSAYEASQYGQGLLTYALLEGIKGAALKNQTSVETGTLFDYAVNRVPKMDISNGASGLQSPRIFGATSIPIGLMTEKTKGAIKIQASPLPVFGKPFLFNKDENFDTLNLIGAIAKRLDEAGEPTSRGDGGNSIPASLVYIDDDNFPGAYRVTGTYTTEQSGTITIEAVLRKDGKTVSTLEKVSGKDADEVTKLLLEVILKSLGKV